MDAESKPLPTDPVVPPGMVFAGWVDGSDGPEPIIEAESGLTECGHSLTTRCSDCGKPKAEPPPAPSPFAVDPILVAQIIRAVEKSRVQGAE